MEVFNGLSEQIQNHIRQISKTAGLPQSDESLEGMAKAWLEKNKLFQDSLAEEKLSEVSFFGKDEARGALALTWSGSLLNIGPLVDGKRRCEYRSIGLRTDVPDSAVHETSVLAEDLETDAAVVFKSGPIQQSSPLYKIAVLEEALEPAEEEALLTRINQAVAEDFVEVNKTVIG